MKQHSELWILNWFAIYSEVVSRSIGQGPRALYEKNAPQHAMTPGYMVRQLGSEDKAREWAKGEATKVINGNMGQAKNLYEKSGQANSEAGKLIVTVVIALLLPWLDLVRLSLEAATPPSFV